MMSVYGAYKRLKMGITRTFLPRIRLLIINTSNVAIFMVYWFTICILYLLAFAFHNIGLNRSLMFLLAGKGFSALLVYIIVADIDSKVSKEKQENVEANIALREEVLNFATAGIRSSTREAHKAKSERLKISRRPKRGKESVLLIHCMTCMAIDSS
jgi:hypothetical protein